MGRDSQYSELYVNKKGTIMSPGTGNSSPKAHSRLLHPFTLMHPISSNFISDRGPAPAGKPTMWRGSPHPEHDKVRQDPGCRSFRAGASFGSPPASEHVRDAAAGMREKSSKTCDPFLFNRRRIHMSAGLHFRRSNLRHSPDSESVVLLESRTARCCIRSSTKLAGNAIRNMGQRGGWHREPD
jgi:hypothetical protein